MVSFMYLGRFGRLGNQLFEIATTYSVAKKYNLEYYFNSWKHNKYLKNKIPTSKFSQYDFRTYNEPYFHYKDINLLNREDNWDLRGYFQSYKYFDDYKQDIIEQFELTDDLIFYIENKYPFLVDGIHTCSINVRRGDFLDPNIKDYHHIVPIDYYKKAIKHLYDGNTDNIKFIVVSDDIPWCKENLSQELGLDLTFIEDEIDITQLKILSYCRDNIMAASSFSWWGSYLNKNENCRVIGPKKWFGPLYENKHDTKDLMPENWIRL